jgi:hypothetical protein
MIFDQADTTYTNSGTINDGVTIAASGIRLTNADSGRMYGGVTFATGGSTLINELGGVISLSQLDGTFAVLVSGSDGADTLINEGLISGKIGLGAGADVFVDRDGSTYGVDLGSGDDTYRVEGLQPEMLNAAGGDGQDRLVFAASGGQYWSSNLSGFEQLAFENGGNFENFSGFQSISVGPLSDAWSFVNLLNCLNPAADLTMDRAWAILNNSSVRSIAGGDGADAVEITPGSSIANGIALAGGDDTLILDSNQSAGTPAIGFPADGGSGIDTLMLTWWAAGDRSYDFSSVQGFEKLNVNAWYIADPAIARVSHISGLTDVDIGQKVTLILSDSLLPDARVGGAFGGGLTLETGTVISRYGFPESGFWDTRLDIAQGNPALSTTIVNHGTISGAVRFYIGDDVYDGRDGSVGGTIYGNAGNDTLLGGAAGETMEGGYGADVLEGNGGADTLTGGFGHDTFRGNAAGLNGDAITDFEAADKIVITDANLAGFTFSLTGNTLTYTGGSLTLSSVPSGILVASAAAGGGVQLTLSPFVPAVGHSGDFNGDGRDDILWRNDDGRMSDWLGASNGGFFDNAANAYTNVPTSWHMAGVGDFNGDGRDDILWRNDDGRMSDWLGASNGGFVDNAANAYTNVPTSWHMAGVGDFNGDGKDDILWRDTASGLTVDWLGQANGSFASNWSNSAVNISTDWKVAGIGDFNGDGLSDILWRNTSGLTVDWLGTATGGFTSNYASSVAQVSTDWKVAGTGDFNGDGHDDILWRNDSGLVTEWLG